MERKAIDRCRLGGVVVGSGRIAVVMVGWLADDDDSHLMRGGASMGADRAAGSVRLPTIEMSKCLLTVWVRGE